MEGLLCKKCFDKKESDFNKKKDFCSVCGNKLGLIRYNAKSSWKIKGQLCRKLLGYHKKPNMKNNQCLKN